VHPQALPIRSLRHHWRSALAVALGVAVGTAALAGALLVGDSLRGSLRDNAVERLGHVSFAVRAPHFFRTALADELGATAELRSPNPNVAPAILVRGSATVPDGGAVAPGVSLIGADERFWCLGTGSQSPPAEPNARAVIITAPLADELGVRAGDEVILRTGSPSAISAEMLMGRRDDRTTALRLVVQQVIPAEGLGAFALDPRQGPSRNAYVPLTTLQRALGQPDRINTLVFTATTAALTSLLKQHVTLADYGLRLRADAPRGCVTLESDAFLLAPPIEAAARAATRSLNLQATPLLTYLANEIAIAPNPDSPTRDPNQTVPYSTVVAFEPCAAMRAGLYLVDGTPAPMLNAGEILLNDWTAAELAAQPGDTVRLTYHVTEALGHLATRSATFHLRGIVKLADAAADPGLAPDYPGVTDTTRISDWDPPFPVDLQKVRPQDEDYWRLHRATPKAFVTLDDGRRLWVEQGERFGRLTAWRVYSRAGQRTEDLCAAFTQHLLRALDPAAAGLHVEAVRARALAASAGTTDFAGLFVGFSFFLIASAAMLVALLFRLSVERRAREVGLLLAVGFTPRRVAALLLTEGVAVALAGGLLGLPAARGYAWLMLAGLRSWWRDAAQTPFLRLHAEPVSYAYGLAGGVLVAILAMAWSLRGLARRPARALLAGATEPAPRIGMTANALRRSRWAVLTAIASGLAAIALVVASLLSRAVPATAAFFGGGTLLLIATLAVLAAWLCRTPRTSATMSGRGALLRLGLRNARRHRGRSLLTAALIACATFLITALQSMQLEAPTDPTRRDSGTGGFTLMAELAVPPVSDLRTPAGRDTLGFSAAAQTALSATRIYGLRLRPGDEASCLSLYLPTHPRILGADHDFIARGGFTFSTTLAQSSDERANPWRLLEHPLPDGAVPTIADEAAALWQLHKQLGDDVTITDERGREIRLRLVALLKGSILQGELVVASESFTQLFPSVTGQGFLLMEAPPAQVTDLRKVLQRELADYGCSATPTADRLAALFAVQNTYLGTFQTLGGLGLLLGTLGLAAVLLRNVWERRSELALLRAVGFAPVDLGLLVWVENAVLVVAGLAAGLVSAAVVVAPHLVTRAAPFPWASLLAMFALIGLAGMAAGALALIGALREPLLPALRAE